MNKKNNLIVLALLLNVLSSCNFLKSSKENNMNNEITLQSGLKYTVLKDPNASSKDLKNGQLVSVHYTGWLEENGEKGKKFDSSLDRGEPFSFVLGVGEVIKGWDEGIASMKIGEQRRLIIPSELGYGSTGIGSVIPGGATLIFDVELLEAK